MADNSTEAAIAAINEVVAGLAAAAAGDSPAGKADGDTFWVAIAGFLVFFMHAGFAMLEVGSVRAKNKVNILFKNVGTITLGGVSYFLIGFSFAYGSGPDGGDQTLIGFIGWGNLAGDGFEQAPGDNIYGLRITWFFQWAFCVTAATIVSGAVAGRVLLPGYFILAFWITAFVYPVVSHWVWSSFGFLSAFLGDDGDFFLKDSYIYACGVFDYAGSGVVHMTGGIAALVAAKILGPRVGRFGENGEKMPGQNLAMATLGTFILWFGWYGFNCGSALAFDGVNAQKVAVTTSLAPASACLASIVIQKVRKGYFELPTALNCILGGLVSITAGCSIVEDWAAIPIGFVGALVYIYSAEMLEKYEIDDPIGAAPVHGFCGIWGVLAVGIFGSPRFVAAAYSCPNNPPSNGSYWDPLPGYQMLTQLVLVLCIIGWVTVTVAPVCFILLKAGIFRVPDDDQEDGLDVLEHLRPSGSETEVEVKDVPKDDPKDDDNAGSPSNIEQEL